MKQIFITLFLLLICSSVRAADVVRLAVAEWPPFEYTEQNIQKGIDVEIIKAAFHELGIETEITFYPWKRCLLLAQKKDVDGIFTLAKTDERSAFLLFHKESVNQSINVFFYRNSAPHLFRTYEDLKGLRIGISPDYTYGSDFDAYREKLYFETDTGADEEQNFRKLAAGRIDLFVCDRTVGIYMLNKLGLRSSISYLPGNVSSFNMYLGFSKKPGNEKLAARFDEALRSIKKKGIYQRIYSSYLK